MKWLINLFRKFFSLFSKKKNPKPEPLPPDLPPDPVPPPEPEMVKIKLCSISKLLPNKNCKDIVKRKFVKGNEPKKKCTLCVPSLKVIVDNPKPDWMPLMICEIVDLPFNVGWKYSWEELEEVIQGLSLAGCDGIRIFATSWKFGDMPLIEPFKKTNQGAYTFFRKNPLWDDALKRFVDLLHKYHMIAYVDMYDNCSKNEEWNPFRNNIHKFSHGFYGYKARIRTDKKDDDGKPIYLNEVDFMIKYWDNRILACLDPDRDVVSLVNEGKCHVENDVSKRKVWAEKWGVTRAKNIFSKGFKEPITFSGELTGQKLHGFISKEEHPELGWTYRTSCKQVHGLGLAAHVLERFANQSQRRLFSYSDDGVGTQPWNKIAEALRGNCEVQANGKKYACTANTEERIKCVSAFIGQLKNVTFCHSVGFLPREVSGNVKLIDFDYEVSANIYWKLALALWGVDIRRKLSS